MVVGCTDPDVERCIISCENDQQYALKFKSGKSFSVPSNVLHRSGLLSGVVEEVEPDQDCTCVVAQARIESWLDYISRGEADTSLSEESALSALLEMWEAVAVTRIYAQMVLQAADFLVDLKVVAELSRLLGSKLVSTQSTSSSKEQILTRLPSSLLHSVLQAACDAAPLCQFINSIPASFHAAAVLANQSSESDGASPRSLQLPWHEEHAEGSMRAMQAALEACNSIVALELCHSDAWEYVRQSGNEARQATELVFHAPGIARIETRRGMMGNSRRNKRSPSLLRLPESQEDSMSLPWGYKQQGPSLIRADKLCAELVQLCEGFKHLKEFTLSCGVLGTATVTAVNSAFSDRKWPSLHSFAIQHCAAGWIESDEDNQLLSGGSEKLNARAQLLLPNDENVAKSLKGDQQESTQAGAAHSASSSARVVTSFDRAALAAACTLHTLCCKLSSKAVNVDWFERLRRVSIDPYVTLRVITAQEPPACPEDDAQHANGSASDGMHCGLQLLHMYGCFMDNGTKSQMPYPSCLGQWERLISQSSTLEEVCVGQVFDDGTDVILARAVGAHAKLQSDRKESARIVAGKRPREDSSSDHNDAFNTSGSLLHTMCLHATYGPIHMPPLCDVSLQSILHSCTRLKNLTLGHWKVEVGHTDPTLMVSQGAQRLLRRTHGAKELEHFSLAIDSDIEDLEELGELSNSLACLVSPHLKSLRLDCPAVAEEDRWASVFMPIFTPVLMTATALTALTLSTGHPNLGLSSALPAALPVLTSLKVLDVRAGSDWEPDTLISLAAALQEMPQLHTLLIPELRNADMEAMAALVSAIASRPQLQAISFSFCRNAGAVKELTKGLCAATQLTQIEFTGVNFDADPTENLSTAFHSIQLEVLRVKEVTFQTTDQAARLSRSLLGMRGLRELSFSDVHIPFNANAQLRAPVEALQCLALARGLTSLRVEGYSPMVTLLCSALAQLRNLRRLELITRITATEASQVVAASQGLHVTSMALGHLLGFNEQTPLLQLMTGLRSIPCLASLVLLFADWSGEEHVSSRELMNTFNEHRRAGWSAITSWDALHEPVNA